MAITALALSGAAIVNARYYAALTATYESANAGTINVEKVNGLIYAVVMDSRGVYMTPDAEGRKQFIAGIRKFNAQIAKVIANWQKTVTGDDAELFAEFSKRIIAFINYREELARLAESGDPAAARTWGVKSRSMRQALNADLDKLTAVYAQPRQARLQSD